jgi:hypothetical protein
LKDIGIPNIKQVYSDGKRNEPTRVHDEYIFFKYFSEIAAFPFTETLCRQYSVSARTSPRSEMMAMTADQSPEHDDGREIV